MKKYPQRSFEFWEICGRVGPYREFVRDYPRELGIIVGGLKQTALDKEVCARRKQKLISRDCSTVLKVSGQRKNVQCLVL